MIPIFFGLQLFPARPLLPGGSVSPSCKRIADVDGTASLEPSGALGAGLQLLALMGQGSGGLSGVGGMGRGRRGKASSRGGAPGQQKRRQAVSSNAVLRVPLADVRVVERCAESADLVQE
jgi:hypothetical protein